MLEHLAPGLLSWASDLDEATRAQALMTARHPALAGHVALMPDAHLGIGATIGTVIATEAAVIPSAVGVDIGCGMAAVEFGLQALHLPDSLDAIVDRWRERIPAGVGRGHADALDRGFAAFLADHPFPGHPSHVQRAAAQFGSLASGNHFLELCVDERQATWVVLHSGSRGIGNQMAQAAIKDAKRVCRQWDITLEDPELAYFVQGTPEFDAYLRQLRWAQAYAAANRALLLDLATAAVRDVLAAAHGLVALPAVAAPINCHHNYAEMEAHGGRNLWITRKGAIRARVGDFGIIPGSMGAATYIVTGRGNPASYQSCSHGAGRRMSRTQARREITPETLRAAMGSRAWLAESAADLVDEAPGAYKDIEQVMRDQADRVDVVHVLHQVANFTGVEAERRRPMTAAPNR